MSSSLLIVKSIWPNRIGIEDRVGQVGSSEIGPGEIDSNGNVTTLAGGGTMG